MAELFTFTVKSAPEHREDMIRTMRAMLVRRGIDDPNVGTDTDLYIVATALSNELAVVGANNVIAADDQMPDTANDDPDEGTTALTRIASILGLAPKLATGSVGFTILNSTASTAVTLGAQLTDDLAQQYEVTVGGTYANGESIPIRALSTGKATNVAEGTTLKWAGTAPPYSAPTTLIATGGLVNGADAETNEDLRARIYAFLQNPPAVGNWSHVALVCEASTAKVQKAFVMPALQGAGTVHAAVTARPTTTNKSRQVAAAVMSAEVVPFVQGVLPEHVYSVITTVADVNADVSFGITLPEAPTANPAGPGGGWLDGTPWPSVDATTYFRCTVTSVTSSTQFVCDAQTVPSAGVTRICWLSPVDWKLYRAKVTLVNATTPGAIDVTIDTAFPSLMVGAYIWPDASNAQSYCDAVVDTFAVMGPGEKSTNASALARGFRHPRSQAAYPYTLGAHLTNALVKITEVATAQFLYRTDGTTTVSGSTGLVSPQVPGAVASPPNQFIPRHIGFYRLT